MEALGAILKPHAALIGQIASTVTFVQFLSPALMLNTIRQRGSSAGFPFMPFIGGFVLTILSLKFASVIEDDAMIKVNLLGFGLNVIYSCVFYFYTPPKDKNKLWAQIGLAGLLSAICVVYCEYEDPKKLEFRLGLIVTAWLIILVGSPFLSLGEMIRNKSVGNMPISIVGSGTLVSFAWMVYGLAIQNTVIVVQNLILFSMGAIQIFLYIIYPPKPAPSADLKKKKEK